MAKINLADYEPVEERVRRFYKDHPDARILTDLVQVDGEPGKSRWIVKASVFRDSERERPCATGYAFEVDGAGMTQKAAALETCETSAIGRALANLNYSGNRRATREEMAKAARAQKTAAEWLADAESAPSMEAARAVWRSANAAGADESTLAEIVKIAGGKDE